MENDLENGNSFTPLKSILIKHDEEKTKVIKDRVVKCVIIFIFVAVMFPTIFCDYYFAVNNEECLKQKLPISLTMYDYLIANASISSFILLSTGISLFFGINLNSCHEPLLMEVFGLIVNLFLISWLITGGIMYWGEMNRNLCSFQVNNYLTSTLILRIVLVGIEVIKKIK